MAEEDLEREDLERQELEHEDLEHDGLEHDDLEREESLEGSEDDGLELEEPEQDSHQDALVAFIEILEVAIHTILYIRQIYPAELFERRRMFDIPVFQCIEPSINDYVSKAIKAVGEEIIEDNVANIIISIHKSDESLEKFIFAFEHSKDSESAVLMDSDPIPLEVLQRQMRAMLLKLNAIDAQLLPLSSSSELSFSFMMQLREENVHGFPDDTFDSDPSSNVSLSKSREKESSSEVNPLHDPALVHIIRAGAFNVSLYVQESETKELSAQARRGERKEDSTSNKPSKDLQ